MVLPPPVIIANIALGSIDKAITLCNALVDRYDTKKDVKASFLRLNEQLSACREKAQALDNHISEYQITEIWEATVSQINDSLKSIESRLDELSNWKPGTFILFAARRNFRRPYDLDKKLSALSTTVQFVDMKIYNFQLTNNVHTEANATNYVDIGDNSASQPQEGSVDDKPASVPSSTPAPVETSILDNSSPHTASIETTTAYALVSDLGGLCKDLVVYSSRALIMFGEGAVLRIQEALVARAVADCSEWLRLLGNKTWYFCGSSTLPAFVVKMALMHQPDIARRKIVDLLMSLSQFGSPQVILEFRRENKWNPTTMMDVSFVNALIFKDYFRKRNGPRAEGKAGIANDINAKLNISASDMLLVLQTVRQKLFAGQGLAIVLNREKGLGWYRVQFIGVDSPDQSSGVSGYRLEYIRSLEIPGGGTNGRTDMRDIMILNFLHMAEISPERRKLTENTGRRYSYMSTSLRNEPNMYEGYQAILDAINVDGVAYTELLEIACIHTLRAGYYARCLSYVASLVENVDERQLVVSNGGGGEHMLIRQGREISFVLLAREFGMRVVKDAEKKKLPASYQDLYEYGRFCAQREVRDSWYDLLVPTVENKVNVNFAQGALTGRGSYTPYVARNMSVRLKDSVLLCDPASDSIAVAFAGVSELSNALKVQISELMETTESERLRAAFFIRRATLRTRRDVSTGMLDVMRSRYMGLEGIGSISVQDVVEDLDEQQNPGVLVECMESLAMQGGHRADERETSLFDALCSNRNCEKTVLVTGMWPPVFGRFVILRRESSSTSLVKLQDSSPFAIAASRHADIYRALQICRDPRTDPTSSIDERRREVDVSTELVCVQ